MSLVKDKLQRLQFVSPTSRKMEEPKYQNITSQVWRSQTWTLWFLCPCGHIDWIQQSLEMKGKTAWRC